MIQWWVSILFIIVGGLLVMAGVIIGAHTSGKDILPKKGEVFKIPEPTFDFPPVSEEEKEVLERAKKFEEKFNE